MISCEDNPDDENFVDPVLEKIRNDGLESLKIDYEKITKDLKEDVEGVHAGYLFENIGKEVLRQICIKISASYSDLYCSNWKDLGAAIGLSFEQISCIESYKMEYTQLVMLTFCQKSDASLGRLVETFYSIKRYDVLCIASKHFPAIAEFARKEHASKNSNIHPVQEEGKKKLLKPQGQAIYKQLLPLTLQDAKIETAKQQEVKNIAMELKYEKGSAEDFVRRIINVEKELTAPISRPLSTKRAPRKGKKVMLTFASDCLDLAKKLAQEFRREREGIPPFRVLMLDENPDFVNLNPANFIAHQFRKMDFIVPILSERYFDCICNNNELWSMDHLDERYAKLVFNCMNSYYLETGCMNAKVRTIIPRRFEEAVFNNKHFKMYEVLKSFRFDDSDKIEEMIVALAKVRYC